MSGQGALPDGASLRYLQLAAKRRQAAGEFATRHDAQLAVARENGQPSWAALRRAIDARDAASGRAAHALTQLRWITARFGPATQPGWPPPDERELREHFTAPFLAAVPPGQLIATITALGPALRAELVIAQQTPFTVQGQLGGHLIAVTTETRPPFRISSARARRLGQAVSDPRAAPPRTSLPPAAAGAAPGEIAELAEAARERLGMAGLVLAGGRAPAPPPSAAAGEPPPGGWSAAAGWANLERGEPLTGAHAFPVYHLTMTVTAVAVLRLAATGRLRLDEPANRYLGPVQLADDAVTIRELLAHTGGVSDPPVLHRRTVPPLGTLAGPVLACDGRRGSCSPGFAGYAALGEVVARCAGAGYAEAAARLVLEPLGMRGSWFPDRWPAAGAPSGGPVVTGYDVAAGGTFAAVTGTVCVFPAAGGLWATAADLVRLGLGWRSLLPRAVAAQAVRPHAVAPSGIHAGLGWMVNERAELTGMFGDGPGGAASLLVTARGGEASAAVSNRQMAVEPVNALVLSVLGRPPRG